MEIDHPPELFSSTRPYTVYINVNFQYVLMDIEYVEYLSDDCSAEA